MYRFVVNIKFYEYSQFLNHFHCLSIINCLSIYKLVVLPFSMILQIYLFIFASIFSLYILWSNQHSNIWIVNISGENVLTKENYIPQLGKLLKWSETTETTGNRVIRIVGNDNFELLTTNFNIPSMFLQNHFLEFSIYFNC